MLNRRCIDPKSLKTSIAMNDIFETNKSLEEIIDEEPSLDCITFPQTIGDITYYNSNELIEWVEKEQERLHKTLNDLRNAYRVIGELIE